MKPDLKVIEGGVQTPALLTAAENDDFAQVRLCIVAGDDLNAVDAMGRSALILALRQGNEDVANFLLHHNANADIVAKDGETALMVACRLQIDTVIERIAKRGSNFDVQENAEKKTALMLAIESGDGWAACRLAQVGADVSTVKDARGETAKDKAFKRMEGRVWKAFNRAATERAEKTAAEKERQLAKTTVSATTLSREIKPLKTLSFGPKKPGYPSPNL